MSTHKKHASLLLDVLMDWTVHGRSGDRVLPSVALRPFAKRCLPFVLYFLSELCLAFSSPSFHESAISRASWPSKKAFIRSRCTRTSSSSEEESESISLSPAPRPTAPCPPAPRHPFFNCYARLFDNHQRLLRLHATSTSVHFWLRQVNLPLFLLFFKALVLLRLEDLADFEGFGQRRSLLWRKVDLKDGLQDCPQYLLHLRPPLLPGRHYFLIVLEVFLFYWFIIDDLKSVSG